MTDWERVAGKHANRIAQLEKKLASADKMIDRLEHAARQEAALKRSASADERAAIIAGMEAVAEELTGDTRDVVQALVDVIRKRSEPMAQLRNDSSEVAKLRARVEVLGLGNIRLREERDAIVGRLVKEARRILGLDESAVPDGAPEDTLIALVKLAKKQRSSALDSARTAWSRYYSKPPVQPCDGVFVKSKTPGICAKCRGPVSEHKRPTDGSVCRIERDGDCGCGLGQCARGLIL